MKQFNIKLLNNINGLHQFSITHLLDQNIPKQFKQKTRSLLDDIDAVRSHGDVNNTWDQFHQYLCQPQSIFYA